jgi:hypothetical protein
LYHLTASHQPLVLFWCQAELVSTSFSAYAIMLKVSLPSDTYSSPIYSVSIPSLIHTEHIRDKYGIDTGQMRNKPPSGSSRARSKSGFTQDGLSKRYGCTYLCWRSVLPLAGQGFMKVWAFLPSFSSSGARKHLGEGRHYRWW